MNKNTLVYEDKDLVDVYTEHGVKLDPVPKRWVGTDLLPPGVTTTKPADPDEVVIPDGKPSDDWKVDQLKAYAKRENIELGDATKKDDILAKVTPAS